jgi:hypothetical protein
MIRLFAPPTRDLVLRPDAVTVANLLLHIAAVVALLVPLGAVARDQLFDRLVVYLVPPDPVGRAEGGIGSSPFSTAPADGGLLVSALAPVGEEPEITAPGYQPILEAGDLQVSSPTDGDNAFTVLEVDSAIVRDPASAAPEYPPHLLQGGIEGSAAVRFVVDSTGEVDILTYRVLKTTHSDFAVSVRRALPLMHFRPAVHAGKRVRQLVEQSFSFRITQRDSITRLQPIPPA